MAASIVIADDSLALADKCWTWLSEQILNHQSTSERPFALALAGGSTPRLLYQLAAQSDRRSDVDWQRIILAWGDERNVPADHSESNYRMVADSMLGQIPIPDKNILAVPDPGGDPATAASTYERLLLSRLGANAEGFPLIDCVLLGLGDDVHTASLFPETKGLDEKRRSVIANYVEKLGTWRITLTAPAINTAERVAFLISGSSKTKALEDLWHGPRDYRCYPAQMIQPHSSQLIFFVDRAALGQLTIENESRDKEI